MTADAKTETTRAADLLAVQRGHIDNLDAILTRLKEQDIPVLLAGMLAPRNLGREYAEEFDSVYPRLAAKHDVLLYPFFLDGVATERDLNQPDGIHPNSKGVAIMVERILPSVERLIAELQKKREQGDG